MSKADTGLSSEALEAFRQAARARERERKQWLAERKQQARALAERAARLLREEFGATKVVLFGSVVNGLTFHERSDVDLAVAGIDPALFFRAWAALDMALGMDIEINLVPLESARPEMLESIEREGVVLWLDETAHADDGD